MLVIKAFFRFISIVCLVLVVANTAQAASPRFLTRLSADGKTLIVRMDAPKGTRCTNSILVSQSITDISARVAARAQKITSFTTNRFVITDLRKIKYPTKKPFTAYMIGTFSCTDGTNTAIKNRVLIPASTAKGGYRTVGNWISNVRNKLARPIAAASLPEFPLVGVGLKEAFPGLKFTGLLDLQDPKDGTNRLFAVEKAGRIYSFENSPTVTTRNLFFDISSIIATDSEKGLLGLAFHPQYASNGFFYVHYNEKATGTTVIARFRVSSNPNVADQNTGVPIMAIAQPFANHKGGAMLFGPDGYLYFGLGDGGSAGNSGVDPFKNGQNLGTHLGKVLRIDVDNVSPGRNYAIPPSNPFVGNTIGAREEIYAYGFRNPWKMSFDFLTNRLWVADVGEVTREEVNLVTAGGNYGWSVTEGTVCFPVSAQCNKQGITPPLFDYERSQGRSITGGYVYRGKAVPALEGVYIYGDFILGAIWGIRRLGPVEQGLITKTALRISSFGIDKNGEVYVLNYSGGNIFKFVQN